MITTVTQTHALVAGTPQSYGNIVPQFNNLNIFIDFGGEFGNLLVEVFVVAGAGGVNTRVASRKVGRNLVTDPNTMLAIPTIGIQGSTQYSLQITSDSTFAAVKATMAGFDAQVNGQPDETVSNTHPLVFNTEVSFGFINNYHISIQADVDFGPNASNTEAIWRLYGTSGVGGVRTKLFEKRLSANPNGVGRIQTIINLPNDLQTVGCDNYELTAEAVNVINPGDSSPTATLVGFDPNLTISGGGPVPSGPPFASAFYNAGGLLTGVSDFLSGGLDAFQRPAIRDFRLGPTGRGTVHKLGAWGVDGDPQNITSEGFVTYGPNSLGLGPDGTQGGLGFYTPNSWGSLQIIPGVNGGNPFYSGGFEDGGPAAPFGLDGFEINDNLANPIIQIKRSTGFIFINQNGPLHGSGSRVQLSSIVASQAQYRANQYGANTGVPGISTFKSRGPTIGSLLGLLPGDIMFGITCVGVAADNVSIPLAGLVRIQVPANFVPAGQAWMPSEYELQLVPLAGPINSRRVVFKVNSEGETQTLRGVRAGGPTTVPSNLTTGTLWSSGAGVPNGTIVGSPGDLYTNTLGGAGNTLWVKESGVATNLGWVAK